jgi:hypothetical protein
MSWSRSPDLPRVEGLAMQPLDLVDVGVPLIVLEARLLHLVVIVIHFLIIIIRIRNAPRI